MDIAMLVLLVAVAGMLAVLLVRDRQVTAEPRRAASGSASTDLEPTRTARSAGSSVEIERTSQGGFRVSDRTSSEVMLELQPVPSTLEPAASRRGRAVPANAALLAGLGGIGIEVGSVLSAGTEYVVRFTPAVEQMLKDGTATLYQTSKGLKGIAVDASTHRYVEQAHVVEKLVQNPTQVLAGGLTAGAAAAQMYQIQAALEDIQERLDELVDRVRDDDHGELTAADALVGPLLAAAMSGRVPPHLAAELAVHRQRADAIYFSRQRFVARFRDELEARQARHAAKKDEPRAWAKGATKAFGDRETFEAEVLIYARAMAIRARLALCAAAVVSLDGDPQVANWMLRDLGESTADAFGDLVRRLAALGREDPGWTWVPLTGRKELQSSAMQLASFLQDQIGPQLPARPSEVLEFNLQLPPG